MLTIMTDDKKKDIPIASQVGADDPHLKPDHTAQAHVNPGMAGGGFAAPVTGADRVYEAIYQAVLEHRLSPGERLREEELAQQFNVSRTLVRQALQRLAQDQVIELLHNRGARVPVPSIECEVAKRLAGRLTESQLQELLHLAESEAEADRLGHRAQAIRLSGEFHQALARMHGNPVFTRWLTGLLPTTSLLMARFKLEGGQVCVAHRHIDLVFALQKSASVAGAEMRKHLHELEQSLTTVPLPRRQLRDVFQAYRDDTTEL
jgi:DNA-binding GntR family transcriptional regulator